MCGLAGIYSNSKQINNLKENTLKMLNIARHRGPDDQGVFSNDICAIGLNRLSIIDLETGHQPIENEDGNLILVCNGEIYNYKQLREELKQKNHVFRTNSDVEVIIHLFEQEGINGFQKLDGMFAFALLDVKNNELYLCRDRIGIKPFYYIRENKDTIYFASEIKSLHRVCEDRIVNAEILAEYLIWGYSISGSSVWHNVEILPSGYCLKITPQTQKLFSYINHEPLDYFRDPLIASKELRKSIIQDIESQLMSDVPLGIFLSGGIDSSIIVGVVSKLMGLKVSTFSIDFTSEQFSESDKINIISTLYNTNHHYFMAKPDMLDILDDVIKACDEPFGDPAALPTYLLAKETKKYVTVALSGDGSDEFMFGYNYHRQINEGIFSIRKKWLHDIIKEFSFSHPNYYSLLSRSSEISCIPNNLYALLQSTIFKLPEYNPHPKYNDLSDFERHSYLPNDILYKTDRMTMFHSLEARVPFLGNGTISIAKRIPKSLQVNHYMQKVLLRKAFGDLLPRDIINQPKHGFTTPVGVWIKNRYTESNFKSLLSISFISELTRSHVINRIISEHFRGHFDHGRFIYRLLVATKWANEYKPSNLEYE